MQKKAQFWYADFLLALLILVGVSFLFITSIRDLNSSQDKIQSIVSDSNAISNSFMSEGYCPSDDCLTDWQNGNGRIGFVKDGKVIEDNLLDLIALNQDVDNNGYNMSKNLLGTRNNYIFYFEDTDADNTKIGIGTMGGPLVTVSGYPNIDDIAKISSTSLIKVSRIVYLENSEGSVTNKIVKLIIVVW